MSLSHSAVIATDLDALLPQTQCGKCGHPGCMPYAKAIVAGEAFNKCLPGGQATTDALAKLLQIATLPLDTDDIEGATARKFAFIREAECIGCTKCIQACPVDAILGAAKLMHTVIQHECTGCDLCIEPCPVDCIDLLPCPVTAPAVSPDYYRARFTARNRRLEQIASENKAKRTARAQQLVSGTPTGNARERQLTPAAGQGTTTLEKLQRNVEGARNRVAHAQQKVDTARQYHPEKLMPLLARLHDLQYKHDEAVRKVEQYQSGSYIPPDNNYIAQLLQRAAQARAHLTDEQRLQRAAEQLHIRLDDTRMALANVQQENSMETERLVTEIERLTHKLQAVARDLADLQSRHAAE